MRPGVASGGVGFHCPVGCFVIVRSGMSGRSCRCSHPVQAAQTSDQQRGFGGGRREVQSGAAGVPGEASGDGEEPVA